MIEGTDLTKAHEVEQLRRSVAMLPANAQALKREEALKVLAALGDQLKDS